MKTLYRIYDNFTGNYVAKNKMVGEDDVEEALTFKNSSDAFDYIEEISDPEDDPAVNICCDYCIEEFEKNTN